MLALQAHGVHGFAQHASKTRRHAQKAARLRTISRQRVVDDMQSRLNISLDQKTLKKRLSLSQMTDGVVSSPALSALKRALSQDDPIPMMDAFHACRVSGVLPGLEVCASYFEKLLQNRRHDRLIADWKYLEEAGYMPNAAVLAHVMRCLIQTGRIKECTNLYDNAIQQGVLLTVSFKFVSLEAFTHIKNVARVRSIL